MERSVKIYRVRNLDGQTFRLEADYRLDRDATANLVAFFQGCSQTLANDVRASQALDIQPGPLVKPVYTDAGISVIAVDENQFLNGFDAAMAALLQQANDVVPPASGSPYESEESDDDDDDSKDSDFVVDEQDVDDDDDDDDGDGSGRDGGRGGRGGTGRGGRGGRGGDGGRGGAGKRKRRDSPGKDKDKDGAGQSGSKKRKDTRPSRAPIK